jgi:hypothetical protein
VGNQAPAALERSDELKLNSRVIFETNPDRHRALLRDFFETKPTPFFLGPKPWLCTGFRAATRERAAPNLDAPRGE